jgi:broad specificity phosphatase PhoE
MEGEQRIANPYFTALFGKTTPPTLVPVQQLYLLRHGQTDFNVQNIVQGSGIDSDLNARGRQQAAQFWAAYKDMPFARVYTSRLKRTRQSVQQFIDAGLPHEEHAALNEISWGTREGSRITPQEDAEYARVLDAWKAGDDYARLPGGESPAEVAARQRPFIELLASRPDDEMVLVCLHGRALRVLLCQLLGYPLRYMDGFEHQNLCLYKLHYVGGHYTIRNFLDVSHLQAAH